MVDEEFGLVIEVCSQGTAQESRPELTLKTDHGIIRNLIVQGLQVRNILSVRRRFRAKHGFNSDLSWTDIVPSG